MQELQISIKTKSCGTEARIVESHLRVFMVASSLIGGSAIYCG
jgi:hypothetical protein